MSTPSGRPANPIDLSNYEPRRAPERAIAKPHRPEDKTDTLRSPYAPKPANDPAGTERHPVKNPDLPPAGKPRDEITSDPDLKRLDASLHWLQCQEAAMRLPRATPLPPVPGLAPVDTTGRHRHSETLVDSLRAQRSLEPERLESPIERTSRRATLPWPIAILLASALAVPIAYYMSVGSWDPPPGLGPQIASSDQTIVASHSNATLESRSTTAQDQHVETSVPEITSERTGETARASESETVAVLQGGITDQAQFGEKANRILDPVEVTLLMKQGEQFAAAGDLVTARILLQRAAEAGDATAAMALGATYDPNMLAKLGVLGIKGDAEKARSWYRKAESFGIPDASQRLSALANR
jgi:hypothetical protein